MAFAFVFLAGLGLGSFLGLKHDEFKDEKIRVMERLLEVDQTDPAYYYEDPVGQVWSIHHGVCQPVF